jgi:fibronectin-binding autotransporter adhesin
MIKNLSSFVNKNLNTNTSPMRKFYALNRKRLYSTFIVLFLAMLGVQSSQAQVNYTFIYTGADQTFTVPAGVTSITVSIWGAGGGGSAASDGAGGSGAYVTGTLTVTPGQTITVVVGGGGSVTATASAYGGGGAGNNIAGTQTGGGGGGYSGIFNGTISQANALALAGGGGGGGYFSAAATYGGAGGATSGTNGGDRTAGTYTGGRGGTLAAGGAGGVATVGVAGSAGSALQGGAGGTSTNGGGGGGGGYYGGGGGYGTGTTNYTSGGGGGSSYLGSLTSVTNTVGTTNTTSAANQAPGSTNPFYVTGSGNGGGGVTPTAGSNGLVVITTATNYYWNGNNATTLNGTWNNSGLNWTTPGAAASPLVAWPSATGSYQAMFLTSAASAITLPGAVAYMPDNIVIGNSNHTFTSSATASISSPIQIVGANTLKMNPAAGNPITLSGIISGTSGALTNTTGTTILNGANTYAGLTTITSGTVQLGNTTALGTTAAGTTITSGAVLDLNGTNYTNAEALTVNGTGITSGGAIKNSSATGATYGGLLTLGSASSIIGGTGTINLSNTGNITGATFGLTLGGAQGGTLSGNLNTTSGTLTKQDAGTWTVSGTSTYTGATTISAGTLKIGASSSALGTTAGITSVTSGAVLDLNGFTLSTAEPLTLNGTGLTGSPAGALTNTGGNASYSGPITLGSASTITATTSGTLTCSGTVGTGAFGLTLDGAAGSTGTMSGIISTPTSITKNGAGTWILQGVNTYTTATNITAGTLKLGASTSALGTIAGITTVSSGAVLDLNGFTLSTAEPLTLNGTGLTASPAGALTNTGGNASYSGPITLGSASTITATSSGTLTLSGTVGTGAFGLTLDGAAGTGTMSGVISTPTSLTKNGAGTWALTNTANTFTGTTTVNNGELRLIPTATSTFYASPIVLNGGTISTTGITAITATSSSTLGLTANSTITLSSTVVHSLKFAASNAVSWTAGAMITITGWVGTPGAGVTGTDGRLFVGTSSAGLTPAQLTQIQFLIGGINYPATMIAGTGEVIAASLPNYYWNGNNTTALNGTWDNATMNWTSPTAVAVLNATWPATGNQAANFNFATATSTITIPGTIAAMPSNINIGTSNYVFTTTGVTAGSLSSPINLNANTLTLSPISAAGLNLSGVISGTGNLIHNGAGTTTLSGASTYTGTTTISQGTISASNIVVTTSSNLGNAGSPIVLGAAGTAGTLSYSGAAATFIRGFTINAGGGGITNASTNLLTIGTAGIVTTGPVTLSNTSTGGLSITTTITSTGSLVLNNTGSGSGLITTLSGPNTYSGATTVTAGTLTAGVASVAGVSGAFGLNSAVTMANAATASINLVTFNTQIGSLTGGGTTGGNIALGSGTLTVAGSTSPAAYGGLISGTGGLTKTGTGTLTLSNVGNTYNGTTTVTNGTLALNPASTTATFASPIVLNAGTLSTVGIASGTTITSSGTLGLTASSTIALGSNSHTLAFANSSAVSWTGATVLTITGWTGSVGVGGSATGGAIYVGTNATGLTAAQLAQIKFVISGVNYLANITSTGEVIPTYKYSILSISPASPDIYSTFSVTVESRDYSNNLVNVVGGSGSTFALTTNGNGGTIGGTTTGNIAQGTNTVTVTGVTLSAAGTGVTVTATRTAGDYLLPSTSATFTTVCTTSATPTVTSPICVGATTITGTSSEANGSTVSVYLGGVLQGTTTVSAGAWSFTIATVSSGNVITATVQGVAKCVSATSSSVTVGTSATPVVNSPICTGATTVGGTSTEATGSTVTVYKNGVSWGTTTTITAGAWSVTGAALAASDVITATVLATGKCASLTSNSVTVGTASSITIADDAPQVAAAFVSPVYTNLLLSQTSVTVTGAASTLTQMTCTLTGTVTALQNLRVWYQSAAQGSVFNSGVATNFGTIAAPGVGSLQTFSGINQLFPVGTGYVFITIDLNGAFTGAYNGKTINANVLTTGNFTFTTCGGTLSAGTLTAGGVQTTNTAYINYAEAWNFPYGAIAPVSTCSGDVTNYIINFQVTSGTSGSIGVGGTVTLNFPQPYAGNITCIGGTFNGTAIGTITTTTTSISFAAPAAITNPAAGSVFTIVLTGITNYNPSSLTSYPMVLTMVNTTGGLDIWASTTITISPTVSAPTVTDKSICGSGYVAFNPVTGGDGTNYFWYTDNSTPPADGSAVVTGTSYTSPSNTYTTPFLTTTTPYYVQSIAGWSNVVTFDFIPTYAAATGSGHAELYDLQAGTQPLKIVALDYRNQSAATQTLSFYYRYGSYVGHETTAADWIGPVYTCAACSGFGTGTYIIGLTTPIYIPAGQTVGIYAFASADAGYVAASSANQSDLFLTANEGSRVSGIATAFASGTLQTNQSFRTGVYYETPLCSASPLATITAIVGQTPTLTSATLSPACDGYADQVNLTGLLASTTFTVSYTINGSTQTDVTGVTSDASGNATFNTRVVTFAADNGDPVVITKLISSAGCSSGTISVSAGNLSVNNPPTLTSASLSAGCENGTATVTLVGLRASTTSTISYTIGGVAAPDVTGVTSASPTFATRTLTSADAGAQVVITNVVTTSPASFCTAPFSVIAGNLTVNSAPTLTGATAAPTCNGLQDSVYLTGLLPSKTFTVSYSINGNPETPVTGVTSDASGNATFLTRVLTTAGDDTKAIVITNLLVTTPATGCSTAFTIPGGNLSVSNTLPTLTSASTAAVCAGSTATVTLGGLLASKTFTVSYKIGGVAQADVTGVTSDGAGAATFSTRTIVTGDNGAAVQITKLVITAPVATNCPQTFTQSAGTLTVNPVPTLATAAQAAGVCDGSTATINLTGLLASTTFTVSYSINGTQETDVTPVTSVGTNASFSTRTLTNAADSGVALLITNLVIPATGCSATFSAPLTTNGGKLSVSANPDAVSGGSASVCETGSYTLIAGDAFSSVGSINWTVTTGGGTITPGTETTLFPEYNAVPGDVGTPVVLTMTVSNSPCANATATFTINVEASPTATITPSGTQAMCPGASYSLVGGEAAYTNGSILWTHNGSGTLTNSTSLTPTYTAVALDAGNTVILTMTVTSNNSCSPVTDVKTYNIAVTAVTVPTITPTVGSISFCNGGSVTLTASGAGPYTWAIDQNGSITNSSSNPIIVDHSAGVTVTEASGGCNATSAITVVREWALPTAIITGGTSYCFGTTTVLDASSSIPGSGTLASYYWEQSTDGGFTWSAAPGTNNAVTYTASGPSADYRVTVTNSHGCSSIACP